MFKNICVAVAITTFSYSALAQQGQATPLTLDEIVKRHQQKTTSGTHKKSGRESYDAHFQRWLWYARMHTDPQGYVVSEKQKLANWRKFESERPRQKTTAHSLADWKPLGANTLATSWIQKGFGLGRVNIIEFHPSNANTYYVGATNGGVWKTTDNGSTWACLTDNLPVMTVSDIDVNPQNPNTIYLCTGDRDGADETWNHYSIGVQKSYDGGTTWSSVGPAVPITSQEQTNSLVINSSDTNSLTLAKNDGIYKSYDGGANWTHTQNNINVKQLLYHPTDTAIIYAATVQNQLDVAQIYRSTDGGVTWTNVSGFTIASSAYRVVLAVSNASPNLLMGTVASVDGNWENFPLLAVVKSTNSGATFSVVYTPDPPSNNCAGNLLASNQNGTGCTGQGHYDISMAINPQNANHVVVGGVNAFFSTDGGVNWDNLNQWAPQLPGISTVHADKHWMQFHPSVTGRLFECNDGGVAYTDNAANKNSLWRDVTNGMEITQFYRIAVANKPDSNRLVMGGAQDNSVFIIDPSDINFIGTGDGTNAKIDEVNEVLYGTQQYGNILRFDAVNGLADISVKGSGPWVTSFQISPHNSKHLIAGYDTIYYSQDQGNNWTPVTNGALDAPGTWVSRVKMTPASASTIYATVQGKNDIYYTHSFTPGNTATFTKITAPYSGVISDIELDAKDKDHFWITIGGYGSDQVAEYKSGNWTKINAGLPNVPVLCIRRDTNNHTLYLGTDFGVFFKEDTAGMWEPFDKGMPKVNVSDIEINYVTNKVYAGTYGRGIWVSPRQRDTTTSIAVVPYAQNVFEVAPNPNNGSFTIIAGKNIPLDQILHVNIIDITGKTIAGYSTRFSVNGSTKIKLDNASAGTYIVDVSTDELSLGRKKIIIR